LEITMDYGSLPPKVARALPPGEIEPHHRPDGLSDEAIEALINETGAQLDERPSLHDGAEERRRIRRRVRQLTRRLPQITSDDSGEVA
jgi:hypothetical protein